METYELVQGLTDLKTEDTRRKFESIITSTKRKRAMILKRTNTLTKRQKKGLEQNSGDDVKLSSTINLNVGGKKMTVSRSLLTCLKSSCLEVLLNGRFENKILRDDEGHIFLDIDPDLFIKVIESFYLIKIVHNSNNKLILKDLHKDDEDLELLVQFLSQVPEPSAEEKQFFEDEQLMNKASPQSNDSYNNFVTSIITKEEKLSLVIENKLKSIEEKLNAEESLIDFFVQSPKKDDDSRSSIANKIVTIEMLSGERISVKHSTLCFGKDSVLAKQFNDEEWLNTHKSK